MSLFPRETTRARIGVRDTKIDRRYPCLRGVGRAVESIFLQSGHDDGGIERRHWTTEVSVIQKRLVERDALLKRSGETERKRWG